MSCIRNGRKAQMPLKVSVGCTVTASGDNKTFSRPLPWHWHCPCGRSIISSRGSLVSSLLAQWCVAGTKNEVIVAVAVHRHAKGEQKQASSFSIYIFPVCRQHEYSCDVHPLNFADRTGSGAVGLLWPKLKRDVVLRSSRSHKKKSQLSLLGPPHQRMPPSLSRELVHGRVSRDRSLPDTPSVRTAKLTHHERPSKCTHWSTEHEQTMEHQRVTR